MNSARAKAWPWARIVTSHEIGGVGLIDRENATVLNAALMDAMDAFLMSIRLLLEELDLGHAVLACSHNDGSAMVAGTHRVCPCSRLRVPPQPLRARPAC